MKTLTLTIIETQNNLWEAALNNSETAEEYGVAQNIFNDDGNISHTVESILGIFGTADNGDIIIDDESYHLEIDFQCQAMGYDYNEDLTGYILIFNDGLTIQTQFEEEGNRLHANFGGLELQIYRDGSCPEALLDVEKMELASQYIQAMNSFAYNAGALMLKDGEPAWKTNDSHQSLPTF